MIHFAFLLMLQVADAAPQAPTSQAQQQKPAIQSPKPTYYQWRDRAGRTHHTTSPPPPNAAVISVTTPNGYDSETDSGEVDAQPTPEELRLKMESVLDRGTVAYWRGIEDALRQAKESDDVQGQASALNAVIHHALWGSGLWALAALPFVVMAISVLFAWWVCADLAKRPKILAWATCALVGLALSALGLNFALYGPQARRLDFALSMLPNYLGDGIEAKPENLQLIRSRLGALQEATEPHAPIWAFPLEVHRARKAIRQLVIEP